MTLDVRSVPAPLNSNIGLWLRARREQSGVTLRHIADTTKLSVRMLEALERDRVAQLPGGIYCRAIVRAYASEIGLDPEETLRAFLAHHPQDASTLPPPKVIVPPPEDPRKFRRVGSVLQALIPILASVCYLLVSARGSNRPGKVST